MTCDVSPPATKNVINQRGEPLGIPLGRKSDSSIRLIPNPTSDRGLPPSHFQHRPAEADTLYPTGEHCFHAF